MVRRLPVIRDPADDPDAVHRPRSRWVLIGSAFTLVVWVPLVALTMPLGASLASHVGSLPRADLAQGAGTPSLLSLLLVVAPPLLSFVPAAAASGALLARFGSGTDRGDAVKAGGLGGLLASILASVLGSGMPLVAAVSAFFLLSMAGAVGGYAGSAWAARKR
jgi:hypothetical protein